MKIEALFDSQIEGKLRRWMSKFGDLAGLYEGLSQLFAKLQSSHIEGIVESGATIVGPVHVGSGSVIGAGVVVVGPAIIGENVILEQAARVGKLTYLGSGSCVRHAANVSQSLILNGTSIDAGSFVSQALVGSRCALGPRALVGVPSLRASRVATKQSFVALGIETKVGAGAIIERGVVLKERSVVSNGALEYRA